jgi:hypothetical protein
MNNQDLRARSYFPNATIFCDPERVGTCVRRLDSIPLTAAIELCGLNRICRSHEQGSNHEDCELRNKIGGASQISWKVNGQQAHVDFLFAVTARDSSQRRRLG